MTARRLVVSYRYAGTDVKLISGLSPRVRSIYNLSLQICSVPCPFAEVETTPRRKAGRSRTVDSLPPLSSMEDLTIQHSLSQSIPCRLRDRNRPEISEEWMTTLLPSQSSLVCSQSSSEGGIGFRLALEHFFERRSFGNDQFEEYPGSANSVSSG